ncbi:MAG: tryptophanase [Candidatus Lloydbacteria bacterium]|nr:tryptophanase [Candidatus Lloydbacteria bacterium]
MNEKTLPPPFKIKSIESIRLISREAREQAIRQAGFNTFELQSEDVCIDLLTDSGTSAMSDNQWAGMMLGDEAYAGSKNFTHLKEAIADVYGFPYTVPTHQGRGAEHIMSKALIGKGDWIPNNLYFTTRRAHQELAGGIWHDVSVAQAIEPGSRFPFKGNIDTKKLLALILKAKKEGVKIPYISMEACVNMAGGQPFSMQNLQSVRALSKKYNIPLYIDATRLVENAYFIQQREKGYRDTSVKKIVRKICSFADGVTVSAKKDALVNIGGFIALRDKKVFQKMRELVVIWEGLHTYGGLAGRDLEAMARGIQEMTDDDYIAHRVGQVEALGERLEKAGVPIVTPVGGHAVFLDAKRFVPRIPQSQFPAQALAAAIYVESGVRSMERGIVSGQHGDEPYDGLELVRLTIPRRVYTREHLDYVADSIIALYKRRRAICGLKMIYAPKTLRFFQARFKEIK